jgi:hypothetical protein
VTELRERLGVSKQRTHRFHMERFSLKNLNEAEGKEQHRVEIANRFTALKYLDAEVDINCACETTIRENINISAKASRLLYIRAA